ncbi:MAG TPA: DUF3833 family protein [Caulobacteraceae bacterium]|jgi:hypothetical protein|nr:DUF3833 family protein [Caulobacteraceae bacterium]
MYADIGTAEELAFRPEHYFLGATEGNGLLRDPFGRVTRRCRVSTRGQRDSAYGAVRLEETYAFDDGEVEALRWVITGAGPGRYVLAEATAGSGIVADFSGGDLVFAYYRAPPNSLIKARLAVRMTLIAPRVVLKTARISIFGAPMGGLTVLHRRAS